MTKPENHIKGATSDFSEHWKKNEEAVTSDDVIDAYMKGREDGFNEAGKILLNQFENNIKRAKSLAEKVLFEGLNQQINLKSIHLQAEGLTTFNALFVVDKKDFLDEKFLNLYNISSQVKKENEDNTFYISFSFMPDMGNLNTDRLVSDGFILRYDKEKS